MLRIYRLAFQVFIVLSIFMESSRFSADELKDVRPPLDYPASTFVIYLIGVLLFLITGAVAYYFLTRKVNIHPAVPKSAWEEAFEQLELLKAKNFPMREEYKIYYSTLSDILRKYLEERFHIQALEMTTEEFLGSLKDSQDLREDHKELLREFLSYCDMVKFAKASSNLEHAQKSFRIIQQLIEDTRTKVVEKENSKKQ